MKKCTNCGFESPDEMIGCPSCGGDSFVSTSPNALGHIISPEEERFWERMTFRKFAVFLIRLQAVWLLFDAVVEVTYLLEYLPPYHFTRYAYLLVLRIGVHVALAVFCIRHAERIISWFVKDLIPKKQAASAPEAMATDPSVSNKP